MSIIDGLSKAIVHCDDCLDRAVLVDARYIIDKLPKTADGVPVVPGMQVWLVEHPTTLGHTVSAIGRRGRIWLENKGAIYYGQEIASTREAAEAAGGK